jgi:ABC-type phosphate transport system substrate-binding protein
MPTFVAATPNAIGFVDAEFYEEGTATGVKVLKIGDR